MINNPVIFYLASFITIVFAMLFLFQKSVINSLLSAIMVFLATAILFYILGSEYNAIIHAVVYGIAVPIILGLSIMFTVGKGSSNSVGIVPYLILLAAGIFILAFVYIIRMSLVMTPQIFNFSEAVHTSSFDVLSVFAAGIFIKYVWAFELVSLLLTMVIAGFTIFKRRKV